MSTVPAKQTPVALPAETTEDRFRRLEAIWTAETGYLSSYTDIVENQAFREIIGPGEALLAAFTTLGYVVCSGEELEPGFQKIALFANDQGIPRHAARQLVSGRWTSKLGKMEDIDHALRDLEGTLYGSVVLVMKRPLL